MIYIHEFYGDPEFNQNLLESLILIGQRRPMYLVIDYMPRPEEIPKIFKGINRYLDYVATVSPLSLSKSFSDAYRFIFILYTRWWNLIGGNVSTKVIDSITIIDRLLHLYIRDRYLGIPAILRALIDLVPHTGFNISLWSSLTKFVAKTALLAHREGIEEISMYLDDYVYHRALNAIPEKPYSYIEFERVAELTKLISGCNNSTVTNVMLALRSIAHKQMISERLLLIDEDNIVDTYGVKSLHVLKTLCRLGILQYGPDCPSRRYYVIAVPRLFTFTKPDIDQYTPEIEVVSLHQGGVALDDVEKLLPRQLRSPATTSYLYEKMAIARVKGVKY